MESWNRKEDSGFENSTGQDYFGSHGQGSKKHELQRSMMYSEDEDDIQMSHKQHAGSNC
jgi:hypothetical protein